MLQILIIGQKGRLRKTADREVTLIVDATLQAIFFTYSNLRDRAPGRGVGAAILSSVELLDQAATVGRVTRGASLRGAMGSRLMERARWTAHSSFCSNSKAPIKRITAASLGKMPTTSLRRLISPLSRSSGLVECSLARCWAGKPM